MYMKAATDQKICGCSIKRTGIAVQDGSLILGKRICKYNARHHRVIYMNTFGKTLAPGIRISYMVLPEKLMEKCRTSAEKSALPIQKISGINDKSKLSNMFS